MWQERSKRQIAVHKGNGECGGERRCTWGEMSGDGAKEVWCKWLKAAKERTCDDAGCLDGAELLRCCTPEQNNADGAVK